MCRIFIFWPSVIAYATMTLCSFGMASFLTSTEALLYPFSA